MQSRVGLTLAFLAGALLHPAPCRAQPPVKEVILEIPTEAKVQKQMSRCRLVKAVRTDDETIAKVSIQADNPTVVDITGGTKDGSTKVYLTDTRDIEEVYTIMVGMPDYSQVIPRLEASIAKLLREHVPTASVRAQVVSAPIISRGPGNEPSCPKFSVILEGSVCNAEDVPVIVEIVRTVLPDGPMPRACPPSANPMSRSNISIINNTRIAASPQVQIEVTAVRIKRSECWFLGSKCVSRHDYYQGSALSCSKSGLATASAVLIGEDTPWLCVTVGDTAQFVSALSALHSRGLARTTAIRRAVTPSGAKVSIGDGLYLDILPIVMGTKIYLQGTGSSLTMESGQTVALGGTFQRMTAKNVRFVEIPDERGGLKSAYDETEEELVLLITPRIVEQK